MHGAGHDSIHEGPPGKPCVLMTAPVPDRIEFPANIHNAYLFAAGLNVFHGPGSNFTYFCNFDKTHTLHSSSDLFPRPTPITARYDSRHRTVCFPTSRTGRA